MPGVEQLWVGHVGASANMYLRRLSAPRHGCRGHKGQRLHAHGFPSMHTPYVHAHCQHAKPGERNMQSPQERERERDRAEDGASKEPVKRRRWGGVEGRCHWRVPRTKGQVQTVPKRCAESAYGEGGRKAITPSLDSQQVMYVPGKGAYGGWSSRFCK